MKRYNGQRLMPRYCLSTSKQRPHWAVSGMTRKKRLSSRRTGASCVTPLISCRASGNASYHSMTRKTLWFASWKCFQRHIVICTALSWNLVSMRVRRLLMQPIRIINWYAEWAKRHIMANAQREPLCILLYIPIYM